jgi:hypothetical protein
MRRVDVRLARHVLAASSWVGLVLGIVWTADPAGTAERLTAITLTLRNPSVPLLLSLACALAFVGSSPEPSRVVARPAVVAWLAMIAGTLVVAAPLAFFRWSAGDLYPNGDPAILEIYTLHAIRGAWTFGPYSQFGWHHPGPLYFYLLAPLYVLSGQKTIALHLGAFAINLLSLCGVGYLLVRYGAAAVMCAAALVLGAYLSRLEPIITNYWNPHIVILPAALYLVLNAAVATGRYGALPVSVLVGSFLAQTHISVVPCVLVLGGVALMAAVWWRDRTPEHERSLKRWILASTLLLALLWLLPIVQQTSHSPGNLTRIVQFFGDGAPGQNLRTAFLVWGDLICALFRSRLDVPEGGPLSVSRQSITPAIVGAIAQLIVLIAASFDARRRGERFHAAVTALGFLASIVGLWSIGRVKSLIGDYTIFWLSAIGTLNWAVIAGLAIHRLVGVKLRVVQPWAALACAAAVLGPFADNGSAQLKRARRQALKPAGEATQVVHLASDAILEDMRRRHVERPLVHMSTPDWGAAAGVVLQVYKRGRRPAVDAGQVSLFGEPLRATGQEDRLFVIADAITHADLTRQPGDEFLGRVRDLYIHAQPLVLGATPPAKR